MLALSRFYWVGSAAVAVITGLSACSGGTGADSVTIQGDVPVAYVKRVNTFTMNPTAGAPGAPGGDLMIREKSSPSATEHNITASITQGNGDVSDPEVSYDGKKIVFSLRCPTSNAPVNGQPACTGRWNIWEYDMTSGGLASGTLRRITSSSNDDDVDPVYLPAGRGFIFSSNRQTVTYSSQPLNRSYYSLDEYERERVFQLHSMDINGGNVKQISFNQSHDRNPVIRPDGDIMYSRWDHVGDRNRFTIFRSKPDGTDLFVLYGAHSNGNSYLHPRDMDPKGKYKGFVVTDLMPLQRTQEGGALVLVDAANYSEQNAPANTTVPAIGGQVQMTANQLNQERGISMYGRVTTPYPLWDGTDRILVAYTPCEVTYRTSPTDPGTVISCATAQQMDPTSFAQLNDQNQLNTAIAANKFQNNVRPSYTIYMFDPASQTWRIVAAPAAGYIYTDPIALQARTEPNATNPTNVDATLAAAGLAPVEVRSVYDTDSLGRMGDAVLTTAELSGSMPGCTASTAIAKTTPIDPLDTRPLVADLKKIKDPADPAYVCAPARFVRVIRAIPPPSNTLGLRRAIGQTNFEGQQILGYAAIEPDGSFKLNAPADTPIAVSIIDAKGRAFQVHTNWIQARPGERRTCDGCHGLRRGGALNSGSIVDSVPAALLPAMQAAHLSGETMASTRTRLDPSVLNVFPDLTYTDIWADAGNGGHPRPTISIKYTGNANSTDNLATAVPQNGIINYPDHIQPLWDRNRGSNTCTNCHNNPTKLDLRGTMAGTGRLTSYEELMVGDPLLDANGQPVLGVQNGVPVIERGPALVTPTGSEGNAVGIARKSRLTEIMFGETLMADADALTAHPNPPASAPDHSSMLNAAEKRLISEWMDLGGQYYNDPYSAAGVRSISTLDQAMFETQVFPILQSTCAANCHQAIGSNTVPAAATFVDNRYVLTGDVTGDFNASLAMISDACNPTSSVNYLAYLPHTVPHPSNAVGQTGAVLTGTAYDAFIAWIQTGCN